MAKIITIANSKGGTGKTTLSINIASMLKDLNAAIIDFDVQGTLSKLHYMVETGLNLIPYEKDFSKLRNQQYGLIICDTPPYLTDELPYIFENSQFVIIPSNPGFGDILEINSTISLIKKAQEKNPGLKYAVLFNRVMHHWNCNNNLDKFLRHYAAFNI